MRAAAADRSSASISVAPLSAAAGISKARGHLAIVLRFHVPEPPLGYRRGRAPSEKKRTQASKPAGAAGAAAGEGSRGARLRRRRLRPLQVHRLYRRRRRAAGEGRRAAQRRRRPDRAEQRQIRSGLPEGPPRPTPLVPRTRGQAVMPGGRRRPEPPPVPLPEDQLISSRRGNLNNHALQQNCSFSSSSAISSAVCQISALSAEAIIENLPHPGVLFRV